MLRLCLQRACAASYSAAASCSPAPPCVATSALRLLPSPGPRSFSSDAEAETREITNPRVLELADQITQLNLLEVSDLTELLRKRLNLPASYARPMYAAGPVAAAPAGAWCGMWGACLVMTGHQRAVVV